MFRENKIQKFYSQMLFFRPIIFFLESSETYAKINSTNLEQKNALTFFVDKSLEVPET